MVAVQHLRPVAAGGVGTPIWNGNVPDLDRNPDIRDRSWIGDAYRLGIGQWMRTDPVVGQSEAVITDPIIGGDWDFEPGADDDDAREAADLQRRAWFEENSWAQTLEWILGYIPDGFSLVELTTDARPLPPGRFKRHPGGGSGVMVAVHHRPAWTVHAWIPSKSNPARLAAVQQYLPGSDVEKAGYPTIPAQYLIRSTWKQQGADFEGQAIYRAAYGSFKSKVLCMLVELIRHEREHAGIPMIKLPPGEVTEDLKREAAKIASEIRANQKSYLTLYNGWEFQWVTSNGGTDITATIDRLNRDIMFNVGAAWALTGTSGSTGSFALTNNQKILYEISLDKHANFILDAFNVGRDGSSPIRMLHELNYGSGVACPRLVCRSLPTRDWKDVFSSIVSLTSVGQFTADEPTEANIRRIMRINPRDPRTERPRPTQAGVPQATSTRGQDGGSP